MSAPAPAAHLHKCAKCGELLEEGSNFCEECGTVVVYQCQQCGEVVKKKFCRRCGTPKGSPGSTGTPQIPATINAQPYQVGVAMSGSCVGISPAHATGIHPNTMGYSSADSSTDPYSRPGSLVYSQADDTTGPSLPGCVLSIYSSQEYTEVLDNMRTTKDEAPIPSRVQQPSAVTNQQSLETKQHMSPQLQHPTSAVERLNIDTTTMKHAINPLATPQTLKTTPQQDVTMQSPPDAPDPDNQQVTLPVGQDQLQDGEATENIITHIDATTMKHPINPLATPQTLKTTPQQDVAMYRPPATPDQQVTLPEGQDQLQDGEATKNILTRKDETPIHSTAQDSATVDIAPVGANETTILKFETTFTVQGRTETIETEHIVLAPFADAIGNVADAATPCGTQSQITASTQENPNTESSSGAITRVTDHTVCQPPPHNTSFDQENAAAVQQGDQTQTSPLQIHKHDERADHVDQGSSVRAPLNKPQPTESTAIPPGAPTLTPTTRDLKRPGVAVRSTDQNETDAELGKLDLQSTTAAFAYTVPQAQPQGQFFTQEQMTNTNDLEDITGHLDTPYDQPLVHRNMSGLNTSDKIAIHFRVMVSKQFHFNVTKQVIIRFQSEPPGCNLQETLEFMGIGASDDQPLMGKTILIPRKFVLTEASSIRYNYIICKRKSTGTYAEIYETYPFMSIKSRQIVKFTAENNFKDEHHQYDGVMFPPSKTLRSHSMENVVDELIEGANILLPNIAQLRKPLVHATSSFIEQVEDVHAAMWHIFNVFKDLNQQRHDKNKQIYQNYMAECIEQLRVIVVGERSSADKEFCVLAALVIVSISVNINLSFTDDQISLICNALLLDKNVQNCQTTMEALRRHFDEKQIGKTTRNLLHFVNTTCTKSQEPLWLFCIPLLHFLTGLSRPGEELDDGFTHCNTEWWGTTYIDEVIRDFRNKGRNATETKLVGCLRPLFECDRLLPRTLTAIYGFDHLSSMLNYFDIEVLANIYTFLVVNDGLGQAQPVVLRTLQYANNSLLTKHDVTPMSQLTEATFMKCKNQLGIAYDLLLKLRHYCSNIEHNDIMLCAVDILVKAIRISETTQQHYSDVTSLQIKDDLNKLSVNYFTNLEKQVEIWLTQILRTYPFTKEDPNRFHEANELEVFNHLTQIQFLTEAMTDKWRTNIIKRLGERLHKFSHEGQIMVYAGVDREQYCSAINQCFATTAIDAVERMKQQDVIRLVDMHLKSTKRQNIQELLSHVLRNACPPTVDDWNILEFAVTWELFPQYLKKIYNNEIAQLFLDEECLQILDDARGELQLLVTQLLDGTVQVRKLEFVLEHKDHFIEIYSMMVYEEAAFESPVSSQISDASKAIYELKLALTHRQYEMAAFDKQRERVGVFRNMCNTLDHVDTNELECLGSQHKMQSLNKILQPWLSGQHEGHIVLKFCSLPADVQDILNPMYENQLSITLKKIWTKYGRRTIEKRNLSGDNHDMSLYDVANHIWKPTWKEWTKIRDGLRQGTIALVCVETYFSIFKNQENELKNELQILLSDDQELVQKRLGQIRQFHTLDTIKRCTSIFMNIKQRYEMEGDFDTIEKLNLAATDKSQPLDSIKDDVIRAGATLAALNDNMIKTLDEFAYCSELVLWLRQLEGKATEAKHLVNHALDIAQGHEDAVLERVTCLDTVIAGFSPLIFDLPSKANFDDFYQRCEQVWKAVDKDNELPTKLSHCCQELDWLKEMKESVGSVETSAIAEAEVINNHGIYKIGCNQKAMEAQTIDDVIELMVPTQPKQGDNGTQSSFHNDGESVQHVIKMQHYTLLDLRELQNKLMLVAGKSGANKGEVDKFVEILDGVTRLANVYMQLGMAGSILFKHWRSVFYCQPKRRVNCNIDFGLSELILRGYSDGGVTVLKQILSMCEFLESCHKSWVEHVEDLRTKYDSLNFFTTQQLVELRSELVKLCIGIPTTEVTVSSSVFPLLQLVKARASEEDLRAAIHTAHIEVQIREEAAAEAARLAQSTSTDKRTPTENQGLVELTEKAEQSIKNELCKTFPMDLINKALESGVKDVAECWTWCLNHLDLVEPASELDMSMTQELQMDNETIPAARTEHSAKKSHKQVTTDLLRNIQMNESYSLNLVTQLDTLWKHYMQTASCTVTDYLSVEHLGLILKHLEAQDQHELGRPFPVSFKTNQPNLIICPKDDLLPVVLSLYQMGDGVNIGLPNADEVLLCTPTTTAHEVDLLLRRAQCDKRGKVYCLAAAGLLSTRVARRVEASFNKHNSTNYRLVIVCCSEHESSYLANLLDHCRVSLPNERPSHEELCTYLNMHFHIQEDDDAKRVPASALDPERMCVRLIKSHRASMGKSLKVQRIGNGIDTLNINTTEENEQGCVVKLTLLHPQVDISDVVRTLSSYRSCPEKQIPRVFHIDIAHEVEEGVDYLLFNLLILGSITDGNGHMWHRSHLDLYLIENLPIMTTHKERVGQRCLHQVLDLLPSVTCWSPGHSIMLMQDEEAAKDSGMTPHDQLMDEEEFQSEDWQRPYQYLSRLNKNEPMENIDINTNKGSSSECLEVVLKYCGIEDPAWSELAHFVHFLNQQMLTFENSSFCESSLEEKGERQKGGYITFPGFRNFVIRFMIQMSRDFATRSLILSEASYDKCIQTGADMPEPDMINYQLKRKWESSPHPYIFFNKDGITMTFMGFKVTDRGDVIDPKTGVVLEKNVMDKNLKKSLKHNGVDVNETFDNLPRAKQIEKLCRVMGISTEEQAWKDKLRSLDPSYVLTDDNAKKILAIYMRFRCEIPVIVMGETGCGKTRLIQFMCDLQKPPGQDITNMIHMKIHGGTTETDIARKVEMAAALAADNYKMYGIDTVLFLDEANTTEAIGLVKEVMCDHTLHGHPLPQARGLKLVAACNPYRKHSDQMISRLRRAGLGYHISADESCDKLGRVPMRELVYRVKRMPQSMRRLIWDFGQLNNDMEKQYIEKIVHEVANKETFPAILGLQNAITNILAAAQEFMRQQKHECSFVSLRDVERALTVMAWFYKRSCILMDAEHCDEESKCLTWSLVLALGVCYYSRLEDRNSFCQFVAAKFRPPCALGGGADDIKTLILRCQTKFLNEVNPGETIAKNMALRENFFMMVVCCELRIPLFLVGKPGSSKSLARTILQDAMQGHSSRIKLFKHFKSVQIIPFQCSQVSTAEGIVETFRQCAGLQKTKDIDSYVAVVVLEEIGLAEDSPKMPLKTLHPLLEDGCQGDEQPQPYKKVGFIGISNWALDPAKMNRGIFMQRADPNVTELQYTAREICSAKLLVQGRIVPFLKDAAMCYQEVCKQAIDHEKREYFGLRDFYSFIKMLYSFSEKSKLAPTWQEFKHAILRNFGGLDSIKPVKIFEDKIRHIVPQQHGHNDPDCSPQGLVRASLRGFDDLDSQGRYLLILTENLAALECVQHEMPGATIIYGSSFPKDQEYTQLCRTINLIKVCMETGRPVVLLKLDNLYESLYDALNQYYIHLFGKRFVYLGLGTLRVKVKVDSKFRLAVVAEKKLVLQKFPIPLINRLEKQFFSINTMLCEVQRDLANQLRKWADDFSNIKPTQIHRRPGLQPNRADVFIGCHDDTASSLILQASSIFDITKQPDQVLECAKGLFLQCSTPDAVMRLAQTSLAHEEHLICDRYFSDFQHDSLNCLLKQQLQGEGGNHDKFIQVTTHSRVLTATEVFDIGQCLGFQEANICVESLHSFDTEQQFCKCLHDFYYNERFGNRLLILQCNAGDQCAELINCARHYILNKYTDTAELREETAYRWHLLFIIQLPRISIGCGFVGFQGGVWSCFHIDDLVPQKTLDISLKALQFTTISGLVFAAIENNDSADCKAPSDILQLRNTLDLNTLFMRCLPQALSRLQDPMEWQGRKANRLDILFNLLKHADHSEQDSGLLKVVKSCIGFLLEDKEKNTSLELSLLWKQHAVAFNIVHQTGTCRRALRQYLDSKILQMLTPLIAFIDTNANLDVLAQYPETTWQHQLWLAMLRDPAVTSLIVKVRDMTADLGPGSEVVLQHTGFHGHLFVSRFPFSWIIKEQLDKLIQQQPSVSGPEHVNEALTTKLLHASPLGAVFEATLEKYGGSLQAVVNIYMRDFVHMVYKSQDGSHVDLEFKLVGDIICKTARAMWVQCMENKQLQNDVRDHMEREEVTSENEEEKPTPQKQETEFELTLPGLHLAHAEVVPRLQVFSQLLQSAPQLLPLLGDDTSEHAGNQDMPEDVVALHLAFTHCLQPSFDQLTTAKSRRDWLQRVEHLQPSIEQALVTLEAAVSKRLLGQAATSTIHKCREYLTRVTILKLFITHVCPTDGRRKDSLSVLRCMPLYMLLDGKADFKKKESLEVVEEFLRSSNKSASQAFLGMDECDHCNEPMQNPVELPCCLALVCMQCVDDWYSITKRHECPRCKKPIPPDVKVMETKQKDAEEHSKYRQRCNAFFMEVVSRLCFDGGTPPEAAVLEKLMGYVTRKSKLVSELGGEQTDAARQTRNKMTVFDDCIDPTPVVRSLLLQLMLRSERLEHVQKYLQQYFEDLQNHLLNPIHTVDLCVLFVYCLEDHYQIRYLSEGEDEGTLMEQLRLLLLRACNSMFADHISILKLQALAAARCAIRQVAVLLYQVYIKASARLTDNVRRVFRVARTLCTDSQKPGCDMPRVFLLRQVNRSYGLEAIRKLASIPDTNWIVPEIEVNVNPDIFAITGDSYLTIRDAATKVLMGEDEHVLIEAAQAVQDERLRRRCLLLSMFREVTCKFQNGSQPNAQDIQRLQISLNEANICNEPLCGQLLTNKVYVRSPDLQLSLAISRRHLQILELIIHWRVILEGAAEGSLLQTLLMLAIKPETMKDSLLPTMPQDEFEEAKKALTGRVTVWKCSNGHPYVIGDCGQPVVQGRCITCGALIGGEQYNAAGGTEKVTVKDDTKAGHILGAPENRTGKVSIPERNMTPAATSIVRALLHMSLLQGATINKQAVEALIDPVPLDVVAFMWEHLEKDLDQLGGATDLGCDDSLLAMHLMVNHAAQDLGAAVIDLQLATKQARSQWEEAFINTLVNPILQDLENQITNAHQKLATGDTRLSDSPLLKCLYEVSRQEPWLNEHQPQAAPVMWRSRTTLSVEQLTQVLEQHIAQTAGGADMYSVLRLFLKMERHLAALQYLPDIVRLQRGLCQRLHHRMDSSQAKKTTIKNFLKTLESDSLRKQYEALINKLFIVWDTVRSDMHQFAVQITEENNVHVGAKAVPADLLAKPLTMNTSLATLLPSARGPGIVALALTHFLVAVHNNLLNQYARLRRRGMAPAISVQEVTVAHLVAYDRDRDLIPLLLANCTYWLQAGQSTEHKYDFSAMQRQIEERFIRSRTEVKPKVSLMAYSAALTSALIFTQLCEKIPQVSLPPVLQTQVSQDKDLLNLNDCLATTKMALNFLVSTGGDPERLLTDYVKQTLQSECAALRERAAGCQLQHTRALWLTLSHDHAKLLQARGQNPFDDIDVRYQDEVDAVSDQQLRQLLQNINAWTLLSQLYECIVLQLTVPADPNADDYVDNRDNRLSDQLEAYLSAQGVSNPALSGDRFPRDILVRHCVNTWCKIFHFTTTDQQD